jgi:RHS repeat-associated protein
MRLSSADCGSIWSQTFTYDAFGNINKSGNSSFSASYSAATNRMTTIGSSTPTYDLNGNVTNDFLHTYAWDAAGRPVTVDGISVTYDANGRAVEQNRSGTYSQIVYGPSGKKIAVMTGQTLQKGFVPLPGRATAVYASSGLDHYRHPDWLGSARLSTTPSQTVYEDVAYAPFGEAYAQSGSTDLSFTGMDQDTVPNLYDFPSRAYGIQGRWPSPDASNLSVDFWLPQTWNRYAYTLNDPLTFVDRNGLWPTWIHNDIITEAFPGVSKADLQTLKDASRNMDYGPGQQDASLSFEHGMSDGLHGQTPAEAEQKANDFIAKNEHDARKIEADWLASGRTGIAPAALRAFGNALHTITDRLSPAHTGYQPWYGQSKWNPSAWLHFFHEATISYLKMDVAIAEARFAFSQTFGSFAGSGLGGYDEFEWLQLALQPQEIVTSQICSWDGDVIVCY